MVSQQEQDLCLLSRRLDELDVPQKLLISTSETEREGENTPDREFWKGIIAKNNTVLERIKEIGPRNF